MESVLVADIVARAENISKKEGLTSGLPYTFYPVNATGRNVQSSVGAEGMARGFQHAVMSGLPAAMAMPKSSIIVYYDPSVNLVRRYNTVSKSIEDVGAPYSGLTGVYFGLQPFQPAAGFEGGLRRRRRQTRRQTKKSKSRRRRVRHL